MGCASSTPGAIVEQTKKLANTVADTANDTVHNASESVSTGVDNVQNSVRIALKGAEESIENAVGKIGETFHLTSNKVEENGNNVMESVKQDKEDMLNNFTDNLNNEATSETETIPASDVEHVKEAFANKSAAFFETVHSVEDEIDETMDDMKHESSDIIAKSREKFEEMRKSVEDLTNGFKEEAQSTIENGLDDFQTESEQVFDETRKNFEDLNLGESVKNMKKEVEKLQSIEHEEVADGKRAEEFHPTFWEQAADAILLRKAIKHLEQPIQERIFFTPPVHRTDDFRNGDTSLQNSNDCDVVTLENTD